MASPVRRSSRSGYRLKSRKLEPASGSPPAGFPPELAGWAAHFARAVDRLESRVVFIIRRVLASLSRSEAISVRS